MSLVLDSLEELANTGGHEPECHIVEDWRRPRRVMCGRIIAREAVCDGDVSNGVCLGCGRRVCRACQMAEA